MPIRFPTEAANADILGEDPDSSRKADAEPPPVGADGTPRGRADGTPEPPDKAGASGSRESREARESPGAKRTQRETRGSREARDAEAKPGKDINQAGFIKDKDSSKP